MSPCGRVPSVAPAVAVVIRVRVGTSRREEAIDHDDHDHENGQKVRRAVAFRRNRTITPIAAVRTPLVS